MVKDAVRVLRDKHYRVYGLAFLATGSAVAARVPLVPLFLAIELDQTLQAIAFITFTSLANPVVGIAVGFLSDRVRSRRTITCLACGWLSVGAVLFAATTQLWQAIAINVVFMSANSVVNAQVYASLSEHVSTRGESRPSFVTSTLRGGFSLGYVIGPLIGTGVATVSGLRCGFLAVAAAYVVALTVVWRLRPGGSASSEPRSTAAPRKRRPLPVLIFACGFCLLMSGDLLRETYIPIFVVDILHNQPSILGAMVATMAAVEILVFPLIGRAADRWGIDRVITVALAVPVIDYPLLALSTHLWQVWIAQLVHIVLIVTVYGLGVTYAQRLAPRHLGTATSTFFGAQSLAKPTSGVIAAAMIGTLGVPGIFWISAVVSAVCFAAFAASAAVTGRRSGM